MPDQQGVADADGLGDAMDGAARTDDVLALVVAINANDTVARQRLAEDAQSHGIVLGAIGGHEHGAIDEDVVGIRAVAGVRRIAPAGAGRHGHTHQAVGCPEQRWHVLDDLLHVLFDARPVAHACGELTHQQGLLIEQLHVHVDVVDVIIEQLLHLHVAADAHELLHDVVHPVGGAHGDVELTVGSVLLIHQFAAESGAEAIAHEVATGVHQVVRRLVRAVEGEAEGIGEDRAQGVIRRARPVVDPIHQMEGVHLVGIDVLRPEIAHPDAVEVRVEKGDVLQVLQRTTEGIVQEHGCHLRRVVADDDDLALLPGGAHDLLEDAGVARPGDDQLLHLLPFGHGTGGKGWRRADAAPIAPPAVAVGGDQGALLRRQRVGKVLGGQ